MRQGLVSEVRKLNERGLSWKRLESLGLEYRFVAFYLQGKMTKQQMLEKLETEIWHYAKRQITWFKRDKSIIWLKKGALTNCPRLASLPGLRRRDNLSVRRS